jgi:cohesin complex subunit SA-1/2
MAVFQPYEFLAGPARKRTKKGDKTAVGMTSGEEGSDGEGLTADENQTHEPPARPRRSGLRTRATEPQSDVDQAMDQDEPRVVTPKVRPRPKPRPVYKAKSTTAPSTSEALEPSPERSPVVGSEVPPEVNGFETPKASRKRARSDGEEDEQRSTTFDGEDTREDGEHPSDLLTPPGDEIQFRRKRVRH